MRAATSSRLNILALQWNWALYLGLSIFMSPAVTTSTGPSAVMNDRDLAMRAGMTPAASAASSTVALDTGNSTTRWSRSNFFR